ncbi:MAG: mechanosensitive ion channel family protein [Chlorobi bacterium]|nr:mechanosensitive ion channel family protein [Chlorobiota bacterium]
MKRIFSVFIISLLTSAFFFAKAQHADLSSPRATIYTHIENLKPRNYHPELSAMTFYDIPKEKAIEKAIKLKYIYNGKGLKIDYQEIPNDPDYTDSIHFPFPRHAYIPFPLRLKEVYLEKYGDKWYYSRETTDKIDEIFYNLYSYGLNFLKYIPPAMRFPFLGLEFWQWLALIVLLVVAWIFHLLAKKFFYGLLVFLKNRLAPAGYKVERINRRILQFSDPLSYLVAVGLIRRVLPSILLPIGFSQFLVSGLEIAEILLWILLFVRLVDLVMSFYVTRVEQTDSKLDDQLIPIVRNTFKFLVIVFGLFKLMIVLGADPKTVLAGASIGGLAIGLASQDTIKNLIGTFMIFVDKPFRIGDWIVFDQIEGSVEEVGFRSSIIRAPDTSVYKVPNSKLSEIAINNKGKRIYRRYQTMLGIRYDTPPELIEAFVEGIKKLVEIHPLTRNSADYTPYNVKPYNVEFVEYGDSSLQILVNVYFKTNDWGEEMHGRHLLHLGILRLAEKLGVGFAFPSQTLYMELFPEKKPAYPDYKTDAASVKKAVDEALKNFRDEISKY